MVEREYYNQNKKIFSSLPKLAHDEHIIHNAIGGRLKSAEVLCEGCGGKLNNDIDNYFVSLFNPFTEKLKNFLTKERNKKVNKAVRGYNIDEKVKVNFYNGKIVPNTPEYKIDEKRKEIKIFAIKKSIEGFTKHSLKKLRDEGVDVGKYKIIKITEFQDEGNVYFNFSKGVENFNDKWKMGFIKMTSEFAYLKGVGRNDLKRVLDVEKNRLIFTDNLIPFYPNGLLSHFRETYRVTVEDNYPSHTLILFTQDNGEGTKALVCYVDLFSTFQYYVILNESYKGKDIFETYYQKLEKQKKIEIDFKRFRYKELLAVADEFGINLDKIRNRNSTIEDYQSFIEKEYKKIKNEYNLDYSEEINKFYDLMIKEFNLSELDRGFICSDFNIFSNLSGKEKENIRYELIMLTRVDPKFKSEHYIKYFFDSSLELSSILGVLMTEIKKGQEKAKIYGHFKFNELNYFIDGLEKKTINDSNS
ncbi:HNH endonuclease [Tenacibaculum discolor]|nr:HNH endonuclease [Tenacibaculum discolor]